MPLADRTTASQPDLSLDDIDELLHEIGQFAQSRVSTTEFTDAVCQHSQRVLAGGEIAIWMRRPDGSWKRLATSSAATSDAAPQQPGTQPPTRVAPFEVDSILGGAVEIAHASGTPDGIAEAIAELVGDFFRRARIGELQGVEQKWKQLGDAALRLHANLDVRETGYRIVNEGRDWIGCDRLSLLTVESGRVRTLAISGIDRVERRAAVVRTLEQFAAQAKRIREPIWYGFEQREFPPEIDDRLHAFLDHAPARMVAALPLMSNDRCVAVLVAECFEQSPAADALRERLTRFAPHATEAIFNARQHARVPFARLFDRAQSANRLWWMSRTGLALLAIGALAATFTLVQTDFTIEARGELQPRERRDIFAPDDGVIAQINVAHGSTVTKGAPLLKLSNAELEFELARVRGEMQTTRTRLSATKTKQLESGRSIELKPEEALQLAADEEELKELLKSLQNQLAILEQRDRDLTVSSPLSGKVLTWNVEPLLASRPVARGQPLLTVANVAEEWELDLHLPDHRVGHVLEAQAAENGNPSISYVLATDPKRVLQSRVEVISQAAEFDERGEMIVKVTAPVVSADLEAPRPGAEVIARIDCGRRSLGFVWFHDLANAVRAWLYL
jgi:multidrug efflux pump subunit AcrA (membrane-fusion protein)